MPTMRTGPKDTGTAAASPTGASLSHSTAGGTNDEGQPNNVTEGATPVTASGTAMTFNTVAGTPPKTGDRRMVLRRDDERASRLTVPLGLKLSQVLAYARRTAAAGPCDPEFLVKGPVRRKISSILEDSSTAVMSPHEHWSQCIVYYQLFFWTDEIYRR